MNIFPVSSFARSSWNLMVISAPSLILQRSLIGQQIINVDEIITKEKDAFHHILEILQTLHDNCDNLGLNMTRLQINRLTNRLKEERETYRGVETGCRAIVERLVDELDSRMFLAVDSKHAVYYESFLDGWELVTAQFPSAMVDIEEASKCFALNRYTATVFHCMRIMEAGLRVLGNTLRDSRLDPKTNPTWDRILQKCREELAKPLADRSLEWKADEPFFSGASARLMAVKDAWRNPTMHVGTTYTEETALDVLNHVKAFMHHLATKLGE